MQDSLGQVSEISYFNRLARATIGSGRTICQTSGTTGLHDAKFDAQEENEIIDTEPQGSDSWFRRLPDAATACCSPSAPRSGCESFEPRAGQDYFRAALTFRRLSSLPRDRFHLVVSTGRRNTGANLQ
jgi:hypothetical protein